MRLVRNKYVPDFWYVKGKIVSWQELDSTQRREAFVHGKNAYSVNNRPLLKRFIEECPISIAKYGGSFTGDEFLELKSKAEGKGYKIQWLVREAHGGGRGARAWGFVYLAKENLIEKYLRERNIWEEFSKLPKAKQINRIQKFLGEGEPFPIKPRVRLAKKCPYDGLIFATPSYMEKCGIEFGSKTTGCVKGLMVPTPEDNDEWDIVVPENENKLKLSAEKLAENILWFKRLSPRNLFSRNLKRRFSKAIGRNPVEGFDIGSILCRVPKKEWLDEVKSVYEGKASSELIAKMLFSYETKDEELRYTPLGEMVLAGESIFIPEIWKEARKALLTAAKKAIQPRIEGVYGVVMPKGLLKDYKAQGEEMIGWLTRFPWTLPIKTKVVIWNHCIFVDEDLWETFGGDYDGDQGALFAEKVMYSGLKWNRDKEWIKARMVLPPKIEAKDDNRSQEEILAAQLDAYSECGRIFNSSKIAEETARMDGKDRKAVLEMSMKMQAIEVQPKIDSFKYRGTEGVKSAEALAREYGGNPKHVEKCRTFFNAMRSRITGMDDIVALAKIAKPNSKSYYERVTNLFKGWQKGGKE